jgi:FAD/FMN-containing dehydrogenase
MKNVAGYDLPKLFVGAYGTLGLIAEATLRLAPLPRARRSLVAPVTKLGDGLDWGMALLGVCLTASALALCRGADAGLEGARYALVYSAEGHPEDVEAELAEARDLLAARGARGVVERDESGGNQVWTDWLRIAMPVTNTPETGKAKRSLARIGVPPGELPAMMADVDLDEASFFADLASGLLYLHGDLDPGSLRAHAHRCGGYVLSLAGPEVAVGRKPADPYLPESFELMTRLKARWDPQGLFNPGAFAV